MEKFELKDYKILMVDDDQEYLSIKAMYLMSEGYNIKTINNPVEALEYLKTNDVDILIVDYFMPEMTGEELIKSLRELNKDVVVILQTGYAGQKPPKEMFEGITIQGYFNKNESTDELEIIILSALRTAQLLREVKYKEEEKQMRNLKDEFFASKINAISGEINEKLMSIGGPAMIISDWANENISSEEQKEFIGKRLEYIKESTSKISNTVKALNIASEKEIVPSSMLEKIYELLKLELSTKEVKLNINSNEDYILINTENGNLPYLICKDIENRMNAGNKEIDVNSYREMDEVIIEVKSGTGMKESEKLQLEKVASFCNSVKIDVQDCITRISVEKVMM